jgi:L-seryl-tRNA(Ser) seleniumtransferase
MDRDSHSLLRELGVKPIINASGTLTLLGGTTLADEVSEAWAEASKVYLDMNELHVKAGEFISKLTGAESAYITAGTAASLVISIAACMTRGETGKMLQLPRTQGMRNEVIVQRLHHNEFEFLFEIAGAEIVEIGDELVTTRAELEDAISERTAAVAYFAYDPQEGVLPLKTVLETSHRHDVPVIVDAAAEIPPLENLTKFIRMGCDLVLYSTGKDIGAPSDTGIILGRRELVRTCMRLGPHNREIISSKPRDYIGRPMKTSKEDILAVVAALTRYFRVDHARRHDGWEKKIQYIVSELSKCSGVEVNSILPRHGHPRPVSIPRVELEFHNGMTGDEVSRKLLNGDPSISAYVIDNRLYLNPQCLRDGEEEFVVSRITEILSARS